jgi:haloacetate dehalogenase
MFDGFTRKHITTPEMSINLVRGGRGDPILLLHGYPQTHVCWHRVAPILAERFTVVCPDLRGYGDSAKPPSDPEHLACSKRMMAQDQVGTRQPIASKWATHAIEPS